MRLHFHGACRAVTGSCFLIEAGDQKVLVNCGMVQGSKTERELNYRDFPFSAASIDAMILTHAHIDHSGLVPKLTKHGFTGPVYATAATVDLCSIMLPDSGHIQEMEVQQLNRRNAQRGRKEVEAIYTVDDATASLGQFHAVSYGEWVSITDQVRARYWNAGHLLGSSSVEVEVTDPSTTPEITRLLFSGDIGPDYKLLEDEPEAPTEIDHLICETTYGDTDRQEITEDARRKILLAEITAAQHRKGALLIPSFAVERTQELLVDIVALIESGALASCPIFIDSPLATRASAVFAKHASEYKNGDALMRAMNSHYVRFTETTEQSKAISKIGGFHIIISASGMCEAGRIRHHLKDWLWRTDGTILLVGYQANGTLGRVLQDGAHRVRMMGSEIEVKAHISIMDVYSGHADAPELLRWIKQRGTIKGSIFLVHGEEEAFEAMAATLAKAMPNVPVVIPDLDDVFDLADGHSLQTKSDTPARLMPEQLGRIDWNNDLSKLVLDLNEAIGNLPDANSRAKMIRRLRRTLEDAS